MTPSSLFTHIAPRARAWLAPALVDRLRARFGAVRYSGDYRSWSDARADCEGYDSALILERAERAALAVKQGRAAYERDATEFDHIEYSWPVLANLLWISQLSGQRLHVLDFGGALGSSYRQNRAFLASLDPLAWSIVEQPHFVAAGRRSFEDDVLRFYTSVADALERGRPEVVLLSSVLQYLEAPYTLLERLMSEDIPFILVDRVFLIDRPRDRLCVQRVGPQLGRASYPAWFFSRERFMAAFSGHYRVVAEFDSLDPPQNGAGSQGFLFQRV